ncbi:MAG: HlyC/CorC family transporter [Candidatus Hydrogenedentota bacterium]|nr:MAG: HlyC/CorC family transporter [Candidatus Hydrogenedentota bacterium]
MIPAFLVAILTLILFSAFFSGIETGFLSASPGRMRTLQEKGDPRADIVLHYLNFPDEYIGTVLVGVNLCNVAISVLVTWGFQTLFGDPKRAVLLTMTTVTPVLLVFAEVLPKSIFRSRPNSLCLAFARLFRATHILLLPVSSTVVRLSRALLPLAVTEAKRDYLARRAEIQALVREGERIGAVEDDELEMIESVFELSETTVKEVMVPRVSMAAIADDDSLENIRNFVVNRRFTRYPVYHETPDSIRGILHVLDLLEEQEIFSRLMPPIYLAETMTVDDALEYLRKAGHPMAIVVDEYGGTAGLVTIEDLLEELVGEIEDEFDTVEEKIVELDRGRWLVHGTTDLDELVERIGIAIPLEEFESETVGGLVMENLGRIPKVGETIFFGKHYLRVTASDERHVIRVEIGLR